MFKKKYLLLAFFLIISTLLNTTNTSYKKNNFENTEENYEPLDNEEDNKPNFEMPPQRDLRDSQPTISVNYRVVKNMNDNNIKKDQSYSNQDIKDDWDNADNEW